MTHERYLDLKREVIARGYAHEVDWAETVTPPKDAEAFWLEYAWVVINSGMKNQIAEKIWDRVRPVVTNEGSAASVFGHKGKAAAIDRVWKNRHKLFAEFERLENDAARLLWMRGLPWIGLITQYHLAKNYGMNVAKPDRHLVRIAGAEGVHELCARLSKVTGDRIATVDLVIWRAANLGLA